MIDPGIKRQSSGDVEIMLAGSSISPKTGPCDWGADRLDDVATGNTIAEIEMKGGVARGNAITGGDAAFTKGIGGALKAVSSSGMQYMSYNMLEPFLEKLGGKESAEAPAFDEGARQEALGDGIVAGTPMPMSTAISHQPGVTWTSNAF